MTVTVGGTKCLSLFKSPSSSPSCLQSLLFKVLVALPFLFFDNDDDAGDDYDYSENSSNDNDDKSDDNECGKSDVVINKVFLCRQQCLHSNTRFIYISNFRVPVEA